MESRTAGENVRAVQSDHQQNNELRHRKEPLLPAGVKDDTGHCPGAGTHIRAPAFPEFRVWEEAAEQGYTVDETNDILYEKGLPLLTTER